MALDAILTTRSLILDPLGSLWFSFVNVLPGIVAAIIVLIVGYFIALGIGHLVRLVLEKAGLDDYWQKAHVPRAVGHTVLSALFGEITKWYVFIIFLQTAVGLLNLGALSNVLNRFVLWLPNLILAAIVIVFGVMLVHYVGIKVEQHTKMKGVRILSRITKLVLGIIVLIIALKQIGVDVSVLENTFLILVAAFAVGIAIALGVGLGKSLNVESKSIVNEIKDLLRH